MGETELKIALRREGEEQVRSFWQKVEAVVAAKRLEVEDELTRLHAEAERRLESEATAMSNNLLFRAQANSRKSQLLAEAKLEQRLRDLGVKMLPGLASTDRLKMWQALSAEIPQAEWATIVVVPEDKTLAESSFPEARVECDASIGGGLIVTTRDGSICVDNSLRCRLLRAWPDLRPLLMTKLRKQVEINEPS